MKLARRVLELAESATLAVSAKAARLKSEGIDVISFGAGEPDFDTPELIKASGICAIKEGQTRYPKPASGLIEAKQAVCQKLARENSLKYTPDQVIITTGGKMAVYLAVNALIDPGDEVLIPKPYWVSYPEIVKLAGGEPVFVMGAEENSYKLSAVELAAAVSDRTRMVLLNSPSNPSGVTYTPDEIRSLAEVLSRRDLMVVSDEIYDRLLYDGHETLSYAAAGDRAFSQTVTINSASKTYAMTGWRIAYVAGPTEVIKAMAKLQSQTTSGAATFTQVAMATALTADQAPVEAMRTEFERRGRHMHERLTAMKGVRCAKPTGAFYCFPNVAGAYRKLGVSGSAAFADRLLTEANVAVVPGVAFGMDDHVRLSFAASMQQIDAGLDRIEAFLR